MSVLRGSQLYQPVLNLDGKPITRFNDEGEKEDVTLRYALRFALTATLEGEREAGDQKFRDNELARKILAIPNEEAASITLKTKQIARIKERVGLIWSKEAVGYIYPIIAPDDYKDDGDTE